MRVSKYVNQSKVINDISFTTISYCKGKLEVKAEGYQGTMWVGTQTWKSKESGSNVTRRSGFHSESKRFRACFKKIETVISSLLPTLYTPIRKNFIGETDEQSIDYIGRKFAFAETSKDARRLYKQFMKYYHPDMLGRNLFPHEQIMSDWLKLMKKMFVKRIDEGNEFLNNVWKDDIENTTEEEMVANFKASEFYDESMRDEDILEFIRKMGWK